MPLKTMKMPREQKIEEQRAKFERNQPKTEPEDPRLNAAQKTLGLLLADYREKHPGINEATAKDMQELVDDFRGRAVAQGVQMPKARLVYFVRMDHVCVWPAELDREELHKRMHLFITHRQRHGRPVDAEDMAMGVRRAYPDYSFSRQLILPPSINKSTTQETFQ